MTSPVLNPHAAIPRVLRGLANHPVRGCRRTLATVTTAATPAPQGTTGVGLPRRSGTAPPGRTSRQRARGRSKCRLQRPAKSAIVEEQAHLVVQHQRAVVEVQGPDHPTDAVHHERLRVHHGRAVLVDAHAGFEQFRVVCARGVPGARPVRVATGGQDADVHASSCRLAERPAEVAVRDEVARRERASLARRGDGGDEEPFRAPAAERGRMSRAAPPCSCLAPACRRETHGCRAGGRRWPRPSSRRTLPAAPRPPAPRRARSCRATA